MEEADALGDTVAIMDSGRLRAWGSSLLLKSKFGKAYEMPAKIADRVQAAINDK